ncbi:hypothetical protein QE152_g37143 [Popillia japonica]|uniref:Uncharacterized protein n=1 Tax=Popillia japonica TaxID=7064 RepID=A0AAW1IB62_POPJA
MRSLKYCRNELGELVGNIEEKTEVWARYFDKLLSGDTCEEEAPVVNLQDNVTDQSATLELTDQEVKEVVNKLKNVLSRILKAKHQTDIGFP